MKTKPQAAPHTIDWAKIWKKFDTWYNKNQDALWCMDWDEQKDKIKQLVEKELKNEKTDTKVS